MDEPYHFWYGSSMANYREVLKNASFENDGYITPKIAQNHGVPAIELRKLASRGAFVKKQRGVYRDPHYPSVDEYDYLREAVLTLGDGAYITADTVLEILGIGNLNPRLIHLASQKRHRRKLPDHWKLRKANRSERVVRYNGIPAQHAADALKEVKPYVMPERWEVMVDQAKDEGFILNKHYKELKEQL
ncbi:hypothetical protein NQ024_09010 [Corynebacterium sp. 35RC1]|nr:hypothetical protein [Corynebacterium sp. 35RC1]